MARRRRLPGLSASFQDSCHTSIAHPWFRAHPERYVWSGRDGPQNNWVATVGGSAWSCDPRSGRWYLHSFYPEQPDLDWRREDVREAMAAVLRFWTARGVDGFRLDAIDRLVKDLELRDDPPAAGPPALPERDEVATLDQVNSRNAPDIGDALAALRAGAGNDALLVGEVYLPSSGLAPYLQQLDIAFAFELLHAPWEAAAVRAAIEAALDPGDAGAVSAQREDPDSLLSLYTDLIALRRRLGDELEFITADDGVLAYTRGSDHVVAINLSRQERVAPPADRIVRATHARAHAAGTPAPGRLGPGEGFAATT